MSHVPHTNQSCPTQESVISQIWIFISPLPAFSRTCTHSLLSVCVCLSLSCACSRSFSGALALAGALLLALPLSLACPPSLSRFRSLAHSLARSEFRLSAFLHFSVSFFLCFSLCLWIFVSLCLCVSLAVSLSLCLSVYLSVPFSFCLYRVSPLTSHSLCKNSPCYFGDWETPQPLCLPLLGQGNPMGGYRGMWGGGQGIICTFNSFNFVVRNKRV